MFRYVILPGHLRFTVEGFAQTKFGGGFFVINSFNIFSIVLGSLRKRVDSEEIRRLKNSMLVAQMEVQDSSMSFNSKDASPESPSGSPRYYSLF